MKKPISNKPSLREIPFENPFIIRRYPGANSFIMRPYVSRIRSKPVVRDDEVSQSCLENESVIEECQDKETAISSPQPEKTNTSEMMRNSDYDTATTKEEILKLVDQMKDHLNGEGEILLHLEEHKPWEAFGLDTRRKFYSKYCPEYRLSHLTWLRDVARIRFSIGSEADGLREGTLRPLYTLDADQQQIAFQRAKELAGEKRVTARHTKQAVDELLT